VNAFGSASDRSPASVPVRSLGRPISFGPPDRRLFGFHHAPPGVEQRSVAMVLCPPFGYEAMSTYRTYRHLAERLARAGLHVLRFDYYGTGNSSGNGEEPHRAASILDDINRAIDEIELRAQVSEVSLFGVRLGALLAARVASERDDVSSLILFGTPVSGRTYAREVRAMHLLQERSPADDVQIAGFKIGNALLDDLKSIDALKMNPRRSSRILLVPRDDAPGEERVAEHWSALGHQVELIPTPGYAAMMGELELSTLPTQVLSTIEAWARATYGTTRRAEEPPSVGASSILVTRSKGVTIQERGVRFGRDERLFGVVTTPGEGVTRRQNAVVFLNVGANHHIGSGRQYVVLARELAARGIMSLRMDASGLGESHAAAGRLENQIYSMENVSDVRTAMTLLEDGWGAKGFVVVGLCSGAFLAFHSTAADHRVVGQVLMNLSIFEWNEGDTYEARARFKATHTYGRSLLELDTWTRMLRGRVAAASIARHLLSHGAKVSTTVAKTVASDLLYPNKPVNAIEQDFWAISDRGTRTLLVYSADDAALDALSSYLGPSARRMRRRKHFEMQIVEGADHTFAQPSSQERVARLVTDFVTKNFT
jgi:pimeloyl-ACP methyl ester carboxylesterase